ncbi:MAG: tryptophan synthase subunit beta [Candidatus Magasanikbacteria bacterium]|nr:tryptophan synthase subunit beta [Candidatus Magasanikbacteria bacterium]MBT4071103.1 tryptophan synthase subunit beta [Candidatus Magasanikbacteria bacterium]
MTHIITHTPDEKGYYGEYGGQFIPPPLVPLFKEITLAYNEAIQDIDFITEYHNLLTHYVGRPSPIYYAKNLSEHLCGAQIYLKREDLNHTGAHKINHCLGEALLAKRMGKKKLLAETGAGQHGVALATAAALVGLECEIHMGAIDIEKQQPNVVRMKLLGATVVAVESGGRCLKDAVDSAFGAYMKDPEDVFFAIGSVVGPHPYPMMVHQFQSVVGKEAHEQIVDIAGKLPDYAIACVGGGSNAIGLFDGFLKEDTKLIGVEPSGKSFKDGDHAATLTLGKKGVIHGMMTYVLQQETGEPLPVHSIASGLDYPGVGPIHAHLKDTGRVEYVVINDEEALYAFQVLCKREGIIPAIESAHAIAHAMKIAPTLGKETVLLVNLSGRGDKDIDFVVERLGM